MAPVTCPYCGKAMRMITNLRTNSARSFLLCDGCGSRSPRAKRDFVDKIDGVSDQDRIQLTTQLVESMAYELATKPFDFDDMDLSLDEVFGEEETT